MANCVTSRSARRLIFDLPLRFAPRTPCDQIQASSGLPESCPKNADVPKSPFPCSGSPGAVGRHINTANRAAFGCGCGKHPAPGACPRATPRVPGIEKGNTGYRGEPHEVRHSRAPNFDIAKVVQNRNGSASAQLDQLRNNAAECIRLAEAARTSARKSFFIEMADRWLTLAERAQKTQER